MRYNYLLIYIFLFVGNLSRLSSICRERLMKFDEEKFQTFLFNIVTNIYVCLYVLFLKAFVYILYNTITFRFHLYVAWLIIHTTQIFIRVSFPRMHFILIKNAFSCANVVSKIFLNILKKVTGIFPDVPWQNASNVFRV